MNNGWIILHRKLLNWEWYHKPEVVHLFIYLLLTANSKDGLWQGKPVKRGQVIIGRHQVSKDTGLSEQTIRTCLNRLKSTNEITSISTSKNTLITIVKYEDYQNGRKKSTKTLTNVLTSNQPAINQQLTTNKEVKEVKEVKNNTMVLNTTIAKPEPEEPIKPEIPVVKTLTPIQQVVEHYKKVGGFDKVEGWDKTYFARCSGAAKKLLTLCGQKVDMAKLAISEIIKHQEAEGLSWTLETVVGRFGHWQTGKLIPSKDKRLINNIEAGRKFLERGEKE